MSKHWTGKGAERKQVERTQRIAPWLRETATGAVMTVKRGYRNVRFEGGKEGIAVAFRDEFPALIDELEKAVLAGDSTASWPTRRGPHLAARPEQPDARDLHGAPASEGGLTILNRDRQNR